MEEINKLISRLEYREGTLYWNSHHRLKGKKAGYRNDKGYIQIRYRAGNKYSILAHRLIFYMHHNYLPELVDHIDQNTSNNLVSNLRDASKRVNSLNRGLQSNNTTGYKGVYKIVTTLGKVKYRARVVFMGSSINLGYFETLEEAIRYRDNYIKKKDYDI